MPKYVSYDEMMEVLDNKYLLPFRKDERLRGLNGIDIVRCGDCKHYNEWQNGTGSCQRSDNSCFWFGVDFNDFCSFGERGEE